MINGRRGKVVSLKRKRIEKKYSIFFGLPNTIKKFFKRIRMKRRYKHIRREWNHRRVVNK